ncbi:hypothetical protein LOTGIDRAFT_163196 [Lottia gigantea]|uniref:DUF7869 domain-containing protein n=1 Tax=Lottia gigantea TaxID=225164 RepID=V4A9X1_LOTGI|nr:hypothetical protein LOTGIDRAFT_163196 [Lottia gigantea]ESO91835.1 hypothetical protein LOTGIDRAFT_163196 [Lottia gigantea]
MATHREMIEESDFDDTHNDPSYETETGEASSSDDNKHTRWKTSNPIRWKKNVRKRLYKNGKEHIDTSEDRVEICQEYWNLGDYKRQKDVILSRTKAYGIERERPRSAERKRKRKHTISYFFIKPDGLHVKVCKRFFLATLCVSSGPVYTALAEKGEAGTFVGEDKRGPHTPSNKTSEERLDLVRKHIESFPKIESHYTRSDTHRQYLNQDLSISKMYQLYKLHCDQLVSPKTNPEEYQAHLQRSKEAQAAKSSDKLRATKDSNFISASFDLQSVLQLPNTNASLLHYSRKLSLYNLCIYNAAKPNDAFCYCWNEVQAGRGSNEIGTAIYNWLSDLPSNIREVSLFSDTCGGQNRNQNVAAMFVHAVQSTPLEVISHNCLESGHSYMECDSMHSAIESKKRNLDLFTMLDWVSVFKKARRKRPYNVVNLRYNDIYNFQDVTQQLMKNRKRDVDGNIVNWLLVKSFRYQKNQPGVVLYKYNYGEEYKQINVFGRGGHSIIKLPKAYSFETPSEAKKNDLVKLCDHMVIPVEIQHWYRSLPTSGRSKDLLPSPAVQDTEDSDDDC